MPDQPFFEGTALSVEQPLGKFFVISISAAKLLDVCYSDKAELDSEGFGITGTQRKEDEKRKKEIAEYIKTKEAAFPNSIILGANYTEDGQFVESSDAWRIEESEKGEYKLIIPKKLQLASIIDGQHRLRSFKNLSYENREEFQLLCSVYLDLPIPYHAYLFSTINFNQKKVDRSLAYNLFGFDIDASEPDKWVPETLSVALSRKLNLENTPFKNGISLGVIGSISTNSEVKVSMATVVDGLLKLISKKPKQDRALMMQHDRKDRTRACLPDDGSPLRFLYQQGYDEVIYEVVLNYFTVIDELFWKTASENSYIKKTIGIQALFDVLNTILQGFSERLDGEVDDFRNKLLPAYNANLDFSDAEASGIGRSKIKKMILDYI